jgi:hypothetical protein
LPSANRWAAERRTGKGDGSGSPRFAIEIADRCDGICAEKLFRADLESVGRWSEFPDMIAALTKGTIGRGQPLPSWAAQATDAHEAFAHAFRAVIGGDPVYHRAFPNVTGLVRQIVGL